jgi:WD40 repeat protein
VEFNWYMIHIHTIMQCNRCVWAQAAQLISTKQKKQPRTFEHHTQEVTSVAWLPHTSTSTGSSATSSDDNDRFVSASLDKTIVICTLQGQVRTSY